MTTAAGLRTFALVVLAAGALVAEALMLFAGRNNTHYLLTAVFAVWVGSPFAILFATERVSERWPLGTRTALYWLMLVVTFGSVAVYTRRILYPPNAQGAAVFVAVPPVCWLLIALTLLLSLAAARARSRTPPA